MSIRCGILAALLLVAAPGLAIDLDTPAGTWTVGGYAEFYPVFPVDPDTQRQRPAGLFSLDLTGDVHPKLQFFASNRLLVGGFPEDARGYDLYNLTDTFQNVSPAWEIDELYADLSLGSVDFRLGKQKFAWGKLDTFQPTDILNPQWYNDPFLVDEKDGKIGVPAVQATYYAPSLPVGWPSDLSLALVWIPVSVSTRFPIPAERWFPPAIDVGKSISVPPLSLFPENPIVIENDLETANHRPPEGLDDGGVGLRVGGFYGKADWALYFYDGQETDPAFDFTPVVYWPDAQQAMPGKPPALPAPGDPFLLASTSTLTPRFERIRLFGADGAYEVAGFTIRAEGAYGMDRLLPRSVQSLVSGQNVLDAIGSPEDQAELAAKLLAGESVTLDLGDLFETSDTIEWGLGVDYLYDGWLPLVQVNQTVVLEDTPELLISHVDTQLLLALRKSFFADRLDTELIAIQGLARGYTVGIARFAYAVTDHLRGELGYLLLAGSGRSLYGQFHDNDEGFLRIRYSF